MGLPSIGPLELIIILAIALLVVGPGRLPEMGNAIGRTIREFRHASSDLTGGTKVKTESSATAVATAPAQGQPNTIGGAVEPNTTVDPPSSTSRASEPESNGDDA